MQTLRAIRTGISSVNSAMDGYGISVPKYMPGWLLLSQILTESPSCTSIGQHQSSAGRPALFAGECFRIFDRAKMSVLEALQRAKVKGWLAAADGGRSTAEDNDQEISVSHPEAAAAQIHDKDDEKDAELDEIDALFTKLTTSYLDEDSQHLSKKESVCSDMTSVSTKVSSSASIQSTEKIQNLQPSVKTNLQPTARLSRRQFDAEESQKKWMQWNAEGASSESKDTDQISKQPKNPDKSKFVFGSKISFELKKNIPGNHVQGSKQNVAPLPNDQGKFQAGLNFPFSYVCQK